MRNEPATVTERLEEHFRGVDRGNRLKAVLFAGVVFVATAIVFVVIVLAR